jgi:uncharacterized glyoxalase superfamily protein PhnB
MAQTPVTNFHHASPILRVKDLAASLEHYVKVLGFKMDWHEPGIIASVSRGPCNLMLAEGDQGNPGSWVWIGVGDVEALFQDYKAKGATIRNPPTNYPWAYEMQVEDPDGNVLRFGSEPKDGQPFGDWLDMRGNRWARKREGGWTRTPRR